MMALSNPQPQLCRADTSCNIRRPKNSGPQVPANCQEVLLWLDCVAPHALLTLLEHGEASTLHIPCLLNRAVLSPRDNAASKGFIFAAYTKVPRAFQTPELLNSPHVILGLLFWLNVYSLIPGSACLPLKNARCLTSPEKIPWFCIPNMTFQIPTPETCLLQLSRDIV